MKRLVLFFLILMVAGVSGHSEHETHENVTEEPEKTGESGFSELQGYGVNSASVLVVGEVLFAAVFGFFAVRHYMRNSS